MKTLFGLVGVTGLGAALGPLWWLAWYTYAGQLTTMQAYQLTIAVLAALLTGVCGLLARNIAARQRALATAVIE